MIVDSHMHVGGLPSFKLAMDRDELLDEMRQHDSSAGMVLRPEDVGHMGHDNMDGHDAAIDVAEHDPNVCLETSGMPTHSKVREAVERVGPDRACHGSDTPFHHPSVELAKVRVSGLPSDLVDRVLGENGRRPFFDGFVPEAVA